MTSILKKINKYGLCLPFVLAFATTAFITPTILAAPTGEEVNLRVARLSYMEGDISIKRIDDKDWVEGILNVPLMAGDQVFVGLGGRAEMQFEDGVTLYLDSDTYIYIAFLDDGLQQIEVRQGTLSVTAENSEYARPPLEIKSTYFSATVMDYSKARFDVDSDGPATIQVDRGEIRVYRDKESHYKVRADEMLIVREADPETYSITEDRADDSFDRWTDLRDALNISTTSSRYVTPRVVGHRDLDAYGDWVDVREYGRVWRPRVTTTDWAPYRHGRWFWRPHYGWSWVSEEPWGWTPYHYGRWVHVRNYNWCWVPSDVYVHSDYNYYRYRRPVWYPALVSFTYARHGSYFSFSSGHSYYGGGGYYGGGAIGWFPLGPHDPYSGWYHHRSAYVDRSYRSYNFGNTYIDNSVNVTNITNNYQNQYVNNAITVVPRDQFNTAQPERFAAASLPINQPITRDGDLQVGNNALPEVPNIGAEAPRLPRISQPRNAEPVVKPAIDPSTMSVADARNAFSQGYNNQSTTTAPNSILPQVEAPRVSAGRSPRNVESNANQPITAPEPATPRMASERAAQSQAPRGSEVTAQPSTDQGPTLSAPRSSSGRSPRADAATDASAPSASTRSERAVSESRDASPRRGEGPAASDSVTASPRADSSRSQRPTSSGRAASPTAGEPADRTESGLPSISSPRSSGNGSDRSASPRSERPTGSSRDSSPRRSESSVRSESTPGASSDLPQARERAESPRTERPTSSPRGSAAPRSERSSDSGTPSVSPRTERGSTPSRDLTVPRSASRGETTPSVIRPQASDSAGSPRMTRPTSGVRGSSSSRDSSSRLAPQSSSRSELPPSLQNSDRTPSVSPRRSESTPRSVERPESGVSRISPRTLERSESSAPRSIIMGNESSRAPRASAPRVIEPRSSVSRSEDRTVYTTPRFQRSERSFAPQSSAPSFSMPRTISPSRSGGFSNNAGFQRPQFSAPRMESRPSFESRSSAPSFSAPRAQSFSMPQPRAAMPSAPSMSMPSISAPRGSVSAPQPSGPAISNPRGNSPSR